MDKNELLKYLICEIDLVMHDKDYRFENEDGTWYSRESCKNLTNEEVFEELKSELRQLAKIEDNFADLEALAESEKEVKHWHDLYNDRDKQFQSVRQRYHLLNKLQSNYDKKDKLHLAYMQCLELVEENDQLKQQLAEERKKVVREIRDLAGDYFEMPYCDACGNTDFNDVVLTGKDLTEILDDVERGE